MKTFQFQKFLLAGIASCLVGAGLSAAPLTWFPGPSLDAPLSGAATTVFGGGNNLLIGGDAYSVEELAATNNLWTYQTPFNYATLGAGAAAAGGLVVYYGGDNGVSATSVTWSYSPSDGTQLLAPMSVPRAYLGYAADRSGNAYALGGLDDTGQPLASTEFYSQDTTNWTALASLPAALYDFPAVFNHTNFIYTFGGFTNATAGTETALVFRYSISGNTWTTLAPLPVAVAGSAAALGADGQIYVVGGTVGGVSTNLVQVYNPAANAWVLSTPLPEGLSAAALGVDSLGRLLVMGGVDTNGFDVSDVWRSQQLGVTDSVPVFNLYPGVTNGGYLLPYSSTIGAAGNPQPTYLVLSGPAGLQVDPYSGAITWTPQAAEIGTNSITLRATNYAGFADYTYAIVVAPPPPIVPTNVTIAAVTDNSITVAWAPENPLCGPTTYNLFEWRFTGGGKGGSHGAFFPVGGGYTNATATISGLVPGTAHNYAVNAIAGGYSTPNSPIYGAYTTSPQPPVNVQLTGLTSTTFTLKWGPSAGPGQSANYSAITSYAIGQYLPAAGGVPYQVIPKVTGLTNTVGTVTGLTPGSVAFWSVQAFDAQGYGSPGVYNILLVTNPVPAAPHLSAAPASASQPGGFQFSAAEGGAVMQTLLIQATTNPADPNAWVQIGTLLPAANPFTFTDTNAAQYPLRFYRVVAP
jgi:hypothetical protein